MQCVHSRLHMPRRSHQSHGHPLHAHVYLLHMRITISVTASDQRAFNIASAGQFDFTTQRSRLPVSRMPSTNEIVSCVARSHTASLGTTHRFELDTMHNMRTTISQAIDTGKAHGVACNVGQQCQCHCEWLVVIEADQWQCRFQCQSQKKHQSRHKTEKERPNTGQAAQM